MTDQQVKPAREQIELRAYQLYLERGAQDGLDLSDWLAAEKELTERMAQRSAQPSAQPTSTGRTQKRDAAAA